MGTRPLWRNRNAALFVSVSLVSGFGSTAMSLAAAVWVMSLTDSSSLAALAGFCVFFPTLLGPLLGAIVDRLPRRPLLVCVNLAMAGVLLLLFAVRSSAQVWLVYAVMVSYGVTYVLLDAGEAALLPAALPPNAIGEVNGLRMSAQEGTKLVAPLAGAGLFALAGGQAVAALAAASLTIAAGLYALVRASEADRAPAPANLMRQTRDAVRFLWSHPLLRTVVIVGSLSMLMSGLGTASVYALVDEGLRKPATFVGVRASMQGAGSIAGGLLAGRILNRRSERILAASGALLLGAGMMVTCVPWTPASLASAGIIGIGLPWTIIAAMTAVQRHTPTALLGRVAGTATSLVFAPPAVAIPLGAGLLTVVDYRIPLVAGAAGSLLAGCYALRANRGLPLKPNLTTLNQRRPVDGD